MAARVADKIEFTADRSTRRPYSIVTLLGTNTIKALRLPSTNPKVSVPRWPEVPAPRRAMLRGRSSSGIRLDGGVWRDAHYGAQADLDRRVAPSRRRGRWLTPRWKNGAVNPSLV